MERLKLRHDDAVNALKTLEEVLKEPFTVIVRDASIQRFEYTFEAFWKFLREYLKEKEGIVANSPKSVFKDIFTLGFCSDDETVKLLEMTDRRNDTSHTYKLAVSESIYGSLVEYSVLMGKILTELGLRNL